MNNYLTNIKKRIKNLYSLRKIRPHEHWNILLHISLIFVTVLVLFGFYLLWQIKNQQVFQVEINTNKSPDLINEKLLDEINKSFELKLLKETEIRNNSSID
jgi:hypothetical protein